MDDLKLHDTATAALVKILRQLNNSIAMLQFRRWTRDVLTEQEKEELQKKLQVFEIHRQEIVKELARRLRWSI